MPSGRLFGSEPDATAIIPAPEIWLSGQMTNKWFCLGFLNLKSQISSTKLQTNHKS